MAGKIEYWVEPSARAASRFRSAHTQLRVANQVLLAMSLAEAASVTGRGNTGWMISTETPLSASSWTFMTLSIDILAQREGEFS